MADNNSSNAVGIVAIVVIVILAFAAYYYFANNPRTGSDTAVVNVELPKPSAPAAAPTPDQAKP